MYDKIGYCCHFYVTFVPLFGLTEMYTELLCDLQIYLVNPKKIKGGTFIIYVTQELELQN